MWLPQNVWKVAEPCHFNVRGETYIENKIKISAKTTTMTICKCWHGKVPYHLSIDGVDLIINLVISNRENMGICFQLNDTDHEYYSTTMLKDDAEFIDRLKLIPRIIQAPWIVKKSARQVPILVGRHLKTTSYKANPTPKGFISKIIDINIAKSGKIASAAARLCSSYKKLLTIELAFLIEGRDHETLPEEVIGALRFTKVQPLIY